MENGVVLTHTVILSRAVLEVVAVAVLLNLLPSRGHEGSADGVVILRIEVVVIVAVVDRLDITAELFKGLDVAFVGNEGEPDLAESVERLESGENESIVFEGMADHFGDLMGNAGVNGALNVAERFGDKPARLRGCELRGIEAAVVIDHACGVKKGRVVKSGVLCPVGQSATR